MLIFAKKYGNNIFSQFGEDGILQEILSRLDIKKGTICEFGAHDGKYCSNSRNLILQGWSAKLIEGDKNLFAKLLTLYRSPSHLTVDGTVISDKLINNDVVLNNSMVSMDNVNELVPDMLDVLSIDVDGIDYWLWHSYMGDAKVVLIEINSSLYPHSHVAGDAKDGSSYAAMWRLGLSKGYFLLCHTGNMIFIKNDYWHLFPELLTGFGSGCFHPLKDIRLFFNTDWLENKQL